jgi:hypothetical protein
MHRACARDATAGWRKEPEGRQRGQALNEIPRGSRSVGMEMTINNT